MATTRPTTGPANAAARLDALCGGDGEFELTARYWSGGLWLGIGDERFVATVDDGRITSVNPTDAHAPDEAGHFGFDGPVDVWDRLMEPVPDPGFHDIVPAQYEGMQRTGHRETYWQYFPAARRVIDLMRAACQAADDQGDERNA